MNDETPLLPCPRCRTSTPHVRRTRWDRPQLGRAQVRRVIVKCVTCGTERAAETVEVRR